MSINITDKIYMIREQKVMLDFDLAKIYGYTTKAFNQQVKNNIEKFDEDFRFQLTRNEMENLLRLEISTLNSENLRSKKMTSSWGGVRYLPYAFTEQGIYMLMTVLKGELAVQQSKTLIRLFKNMKDYITENKTLLDHRDSLNIGYQVSENTEKIKKIDAKVSQLANEMNEVLKRTEISQVFLDFSKTAETKEFLLLDGEPIQAKEAYMEIYKQAKKKIYIIDNYINLKTLHLLQLVKQKMEVTIFTDNIKKYLRKSDLADFKKERPDLNITFIRTGGRIHDRFIILDNKKVYSSSSSSKDAGLKMTSIHEITERFMLNSLFTEIEKLKNNNLLELK